MSPLAAPAFKSMPFFSEEHFKSSPLYDKISCEDMKTLLFSIKQDDMIVLPYQQTIL